MKSEDEIMAAYLLKGGKMLSKNCPACGCPLFEYKGETFCVVCREEQAGVTGTPSEEPAASAETKRPEKKKDQTTTGAAASRPGLASSIEETLVMLSRRVREEPDPERVLVLMNAIKRGVEILNLIGQS
jgi:UPF0148 protein